ncbi:MAG: hypothetical protein KAT05_08580 [Spirochaetes bacterium]|nr:hypothetical protein [Spirochaetota bacterium]
MLNIKDIKKVKKELKTVLKNDEKIKDLLEGFYTDAKIRIIFFNFTQCLIKADGTINDSEYKISKYRKQALPRMAQTILDFDKLTQKGEQAIRKFEKGNKVNPAVTLDIE